jgi:hypothetical protein
VKVLDVILLVVFLPLLALAVYIYLIPWKARPASGVRDVKKVREDVFSEPYKAVYEDLKASISSLKSGVDGDYLQSLDDEFVRARFAPDAIPKLREMLSKKRPVLDSVVSSSKARSGGLDSIKAMASGMGKIQSAYSVPAVKYLIDCGVKLLDIVDSVTQYSAIITEGLDDLEKRGPRLASIYLSTDVVNKKSQLRSRILEGLEAAERYVAASWDEYLGYVKHPPKV